MNAIMPRHHPWLAALRAAPLAELRALVDGYADVSPWSRAEPQDAADAVLCVLPRGDEAWRVFDQACFGLLGTLRRELLSAADEETYHSLLGSLHRLLAVIRRTAPAQTLADLHRRYAHWFAAFETASVPDGIDLRFDFLQALALTQDRVPGQPTRLMPLWLDICGEAGPFGRYGARYLDIGLLGLRRMPLAAGRTSQEEAVCHGMARWAAAQQPDKAQFLRRWREIEAVFPRSLTWWGPLVEPVILAVEAALAEDHGSSGATFAAAAWWREEVDLPQSRKGAAAPSFQGRRSVEPPTEAEWRDLLKDMTQPVQALRPRVRRLMERHDHYADVTGDTFYIVRTACNLGMRLVESGTGPERRERGELAESLARAALTYQPANVYGWALWRDALEARGALDAAEALGWETLRRFPENNYWRSQLAKLLAGPRGRPVEAALLLQQTIDLFADDAVAPLHLARLYTQQLGRPQEARRLLQAQIDRRPDDAAAYAQLAVLLADYQGDRVGAEGVLGALLDKVPGDAAGRQRLARLRAGQALALKPAPAVKWSPQNGLADPGFGIAAATARRALFRADVAPDPTVHLDEIRRLLATDPAVAYLRYAAERSGAAPAVPWRDTGFSFAFQRAARGGSAEAMRALAMDWPGVMEHHILRRALSWMGAATGDNGFAPAAAAAGFNHGSSARLDVLLKGVANSAAPLRGRLLLLADFAASDLSQAVIAA